MLPNVVGEEALLLLASPVARARAFIVIPVFLVLSSWITPLYSDVQAK
jgi:hypothetical protein